MAAAETHPEAVPRRVASGTRGLSVCYAAKQSLPEIGEDAIMVAYGRTVKHAEKLAV